LCRRMDTWRSSRWGCRELRLQAASTKFFSESTPRMTDQDGEAGEGGSIQQPPRAPLAAGERPRQPSNGVRSRHAGQPAERGCTPPASDPVRQKSTGAAARPAPSAGHRPKPVRFLRGAPSRRRRGGKQLPSRVRDQTERGRKGSPKREGGIKP